MFFNRDKIEQLVSGYSLDPYERSMLIKLENDIDDLIEEKESRKRLLQTLNEQEEVYKAEYEAQVGSVSANLASQKEELDAIRHKSTILRTYIGHISTEEFAINKLKIEGDAYIAEFYAKLKPLVEKSRHLEGDLSKLKSLHNKCVELQQKASCSMATAS